MNAMDEDVANADSTACLAGPGALDLTADMGDAPGRPSTVRPGPGGPAVEVGGTAVITAGRYAD
jgi:hypothetical protein